MVLCLKQTGGVLKWAFGMRSGSLSLRERFISDRKSPCHGGEILVILRDSAWAERGSRGVQRRDPPDGPQEPFCGRSTLNKRVLWGSKRAQLEQIPNEVGFSTNKACTQCLSLDLVFRTDRFRRVNIHTTRGIDKSAKRTLT